MPLISPEEPLPPRGDIQDYFAPNRRPSKIKQQTNCCEFIQGIVVVPF
jgi:hypothetical protein